MRHLPKNRAAAPRWEPRRPRQRLLGLALAAAIWAFGCSDPAQLPEPEPDSPAAEPGAEVLFAEVASRVGLDFVHRNGMSGEHYLAEITCAGGGFFDLEGDGDLDILLLQGAALGPRLEVGEGATAPTDRLFRNDLERGELAFTDVTAQMGVRLEGYGCGVATGDYDGDGRTDLYLANLGANRLLRNLGGGRFEETTVQAGAGDDSSTLAATFFDYGRDGDLDLFLVNYVDFQLEDPPRCTSLTGSPDYCGPGAFPFQQNRLLENRGDGTFVEATRQAGLLAHALPSMGVVAADFDGDRFPDLYVANDGEPNRLWRNRQDGTFEEGALEAGCAVNGNGTPEASMGVATADWDGDGDLDLFLSHLLRETNTLYANEGGLFRDATAAAGLGAPSLAYTSFGAGWLDYDNDGWLDLLVASGAVTHLPELERRGDPFPLRQPDQLFRNLGPEHRHRFEEVTSRAGPGLTVPRVSRGVAVGDIDNDGDPDVLVIDNHAPVRLLVNRAGQDGEWLGLRLVAGSPASDSLGALARLRLADGSELLRHVHTDGSYGAARDPRLRFGLHGRAKPTELVVDWPDGTSERFEVTPTGRYTTLARGQGASLAPAPRAQ